MQPHLALGQDAGDRVLLPVRVGRDEAQPVGRRRGVELPARHQHQAMGLQYPIGGQISLLAALHAGGEDIEGDGNMGGGCGPGVGPARPAQPRQGHAARSRHALQQPTIGLRHRARAAAPTLGGSSQEAPRLGAGLAGAWKEVKFVTELPIGILRRVLALSRCRQGMAQGARYRHRITGA